MQSLKHGSAPLVHPIYHIRFSDLPVRAHEYGLGSTSYMANNVLADIVYILRPRTYFSGALHYN